MKLRPALRVNWLGHSQAEMKMRQWLKICVAALGLVAALSIVTASSFAQSSRTLDCKSDRGERLC